MPSPLDARKLQALAEAVVRDLKCYHDSPIYKARDESWTSLAHESLPALEEFLKKRA